MSCKKIKSLVSSILTSLIALGSNLRIIDVVERYPFHAKLFYVNYFSRYRSDEGVTKNLRQNSVFQSYVNELFSKVCLCITISNLKSVDYQVSTLTL